MDLFLQSITGSGDPDGESKATTDTPASPESKAQYELDPEIKAQVTEQIYTGLNPEQKKAVDHNLGPLLILAGARSGKTRVIIHRIARLIRLENVPPWKILAVTFTNKAAREMSARLYKMIGPVAEQVTISTFHSLGLRMLRYEASHIGLKSNFTVYDSSDQDSLLKKCIKEAKLDPKKFRPSTFNHYIQQAKDGLYSVADFERELNDYDITPGMRNNIIQIFESYEKAKAASFALDFSDLIYRTVVMLRDKPEIRAKYQEKWQYLLVDEYQDTNNSQYILCRTLAEKHKNIVVVGDDDQSIYSWRGAKITNILHFEKDYDHCNQIKLEQNYRSTGNILRAANSVVRQNTKRKDKTLWTEKEDGDKVHIQLVYDQTDEARTVIQSINNLRSENGYKYKDFAIFYRTNSQSRAFEEVLRKANMPYRIIGGLRFYDRKEIKDLLGYLTLIVNPDADMALSRVINNPPRGIGNTTMDRIASYGLVKGISLWQCVLNADEIPKVPEKKLLAFADLIQTWQQNLDEGIELPDLVENVIEESGMLAAFEAEETIEAKNRLANLEEFMASIQEFAAANPDKSLADFLQDISLLTSEESPRDPDNVPDDDDFVTLMTFHNAKGLEFPIVYMAGMEEDIFPHYLSTQDGGRDEMEEERRLCYVGMTRAQHKLHLLSATQRWINGQKRSNRQSRFLEEIAKDYIFLAKSEFGYDRYGIGSGGSGRYAGRSPHSPYIKPSKKSDSEYSREMVDDGWGSLDKDSDRTAGESEDWAQGQRVEHAKFGEGKIISVSGQKPNQKLLVQFQTVGVKQLVARFSPMKKL